ncbi:MAG: transketolase [Gemmatimonadetes bacterium]|nr:transketolase [Gemmatimonadota bacterium]
MSTTDTTLALQSVNTIRTLSIDAVQRANSGHPGLPLGAAPMAYVLWERHLKHSPSNPDWPDRDRFVLSAGHGSMLLYSLLHLTGYDLSMDDIKDFRQWKSKTPGHPEWHDTPGVEATTGPLGQGVTNAIGMAIAERALAHRFNSPDHTLVDHHTYALVSDGDLMEGVALEAISYAGHLKLGKLIFLYDSNDISLDGPLSMTFTENTAAKFEACGWQVLTVEDGDEDLDGIDAAITAAKAETGRPTMIEVRTTIGYGSPNKAGSAKAHGSPLGDDEVALTKEALGWDPAKKFHVPADVAEHMNAAVARGKAAEKNWNETLASVKSAHPEVARAWDEAMQGKLPKGWDADVPAYKTGDKLATRVAGGDALNAIAAHVPWLMGGDADLSSSTKTNLKDEGSFDGQSGAGRNLHFGVREHAMGGICNGMAYHGGIRPYGSTFLCFSDYMRGAVRLAALNRLPAIYVWTHDSIALGEDGPTHQPVEHVLSLRAIPNLTVFRPADAAETADAWRWTMENPKGPVAFILGRQGITVLSRDGAEKNTGPGRGAYILADAKGGAPEAIILATGSEVATAMEAWEQLTKDGARVRLVSMPSWEIFAAQDAQYREHVLPANVTARVSIEAGVTLGWERWIGSSGIAIGVDRFGASAPAEVLLEKYGLTAGHVESAVRKVMK